MPKLRYDHRNWPQLLPRLLLSRLLLLRLLVASGAGNIANATVEIKLINTTIGTDRGSGPDQARPADHAEPKQQQLSTHTALTTEMAIVNEIFLKLSLGQVLNFWHALGSLAVRVEGATKQGGGGGEVLGWPVAWPEHFVLITT